MRDLVVIVAVFLTAAILASVLALPAWRWVESGRQEWQFWIAMTWGIAAYVLCGWAALRLLSGYRRNH